MHNWIYDAVNIECINIVYIYIRNDILIFILKDYVISNHMPSFNPPIEMNLFQEPQIDH
jgi:hypothetical protein